MTVRTRLLLVDGNDGNREATRRALRTQGFTVSEAETGWKAIELASREEPDLVVVDFRLPDMSGLDAAQTILGLTPNREMPIIFVVDAEDVPAIARTVDLGVADYLKRPYAVAELTMRLRTNLRILRLQQALRRREIAYRLLKERSSDIVLMLESDLSISYVNRAAQTFMRESSTTLRRRTLQDLLGPETSEAIVRSAESGLRERDWEAAEFRSTVTVRGGTGAPRTIRFSVHPLGDIDSPATRFMVIGQIGDIAAGPAVQHAA